MYFIFVGQCIVQLVLFRIVRTNNTLTYMEGEGSIEVMVFSDYTAVLDTRRVVYL